MKSMIRCTTLALASVASSGIAGELGYNLRTVPATPQEGAPFVAAFDSNACEAWVLPPQGEPTVVTVQGSTVHLEVDRISIFNCSYPSGTETLSVPALPAGTYQLELIGRAYQSPGNDLLAQTITFQVGPEVTTNTSTVSANNKLALATLVGLILSLGCTLYRRRA